MSHKEQRQYIEKIKNIYPKYFNGVSVLDIGSLDINGNNRVYFTNSNYIGIDVGEGKNVDVVTFAHEYETEKRFDIVISTEALEHDRYYKETLVKAISLLKSGGMILFTFATTGRPEHGTIRTSVEDNPLLMTEYYKNLTEQDIRNAIDISEFISFEFETNETHHDLYFHGIKK